MHRNEKVLISNLQKNTKNIRNLCILAHVDHGKTTLADSLLASNGIISTRMSGKLRYMDSRQDEQERGITMKASAISLIHTKDNENYVINLIDSPGHVDFSTEVSTAVRLCDGAAILIDVCEGICPQTHAVLRQASLENLKLILILNKIDRLIVELKMTPLEAFNHLQNILEQFNALVAQQFHSLLNEKIYKNDDVTKDETVDWEGDIDESKLYFSPKYNNVFFSSAIDGWGFSINNFADIYSTKLGFKREILMNTLWGDYYLNAKTKRIMKNAQSNGKKPLFVQLILDNIWQVYDAVYTRRDTIMTEKIITSLGIKVSPRDLKYSDPRGPVQALFTNWLPLGKNMINMIVDILPSPLDISEEKVENLMCSKMKSFKSLPAETQNLKKSFMNCKSDDDQPVIVFISKMFAAEKDSIAKKPLSLEDIAQKREAIRLKKLEELSITNKTPEEIEKEKSEKKEDKNNNDIEEEESKTEFLAFARIFSGNLKRGKTLFVLSPKHLPEEFSGKNIDINSSIEDILTISKNVTKFTVDDFYLMMGRELQLVDEMPCGNIVAIGGLENLILKSATLSSTVFCPSFASMHLQTTPIVRVAIEPKNPAKMKDLIKGLKLLNQSDPCVEIMAQENGEHILCTAGEVHLQRCIEDLVQRFALTQVNVSPPRIPFKETIIPPPKFDLVNEKIVKEQAPQAPLNSTESQAESVTNSPQSNQSKETANQNVKIGSDGLVEMQSNDKRITLYVRAKPLPSPVTTYLEENTNLLKLLNKLNQNQIELVSYTENVEQLKVLKSNIKSKFDEHFANPEEADSAQIWEEITDRIVSFGPNRYGSNMLVRPLNDENNFTNVWSILDNLANKNKINNIAKSHLKDYENSIVFGFNLATSKGPICEEPMQGVAFFIENIIINQEDQDEAGENTERKQNQNAASQAISLMKEACKKSFDLQPRRLMAAMYRCEIMTVNSESLGKLYGVLGKRNAKIIEESMKDTTGMFLIVANIPVAESFGLAEEIRKRTSGLASPHIEFSHFEVIDIDPYWEPQTQEELLLFGDKADFENQAKKYMNEIRKRKGLFVKEKIVEHSEKQRTLCIK